MVLTSRFSKTAVVVAIAFTVSLVVIGNLMDYRTNWNFITHVLSMDTTFPQSAIRYRAIASPILQALAYWSIIAFEFSTAVLCWVGVFSLLRAVGAPNPAFVRAKACAVAGLTLGFLTWQIGFMAIGGEWFGMWQSGLWNGVPSAFRFQMTLAAALIYISLPEPVEETGP